ncbi:MULTISPECIES: maltokinase N-terminal cap-like domain-containing protein [Streptacidiphilus]|uniref:Maltokinase n=1 Tax=Streptacidiphilus cavernicola TaxID=3342716 RepID=A0ABV6UK07_9ACTN|nr:phosphotransferase [Streptacidiphilus jeojiense]
MPVAVCESCLAAEHGQALQASRILGPLLPALTPWLVTRRWFTQEGRCLDGLHPFNESVLVDGDDAVLLHSLVAAQHSGTPDRVYQLLIGLRRTLPRHLVDAAVGRATGGPWDGWWIFEGTADPELMGALLRVTTEGASAPALQYTPTGITAVPLGLPARAMNVEQSNSTVVYGNQFLIKWFRQPERGVHPEVEVLGALTAAGSAHTPDLAGWLHTEGRSGEGFVLGIVEEFLPSDGDGWDLAVRQAADCITGVCRSVPAAGGFVEDARALGEAVARVHQALASTLPTSWLKPDLVLDQTDAMRHRLKEAVEAVPRLEVYAGRIGRLYDEYVLVAARGRGIQAQRIHGDLHLGQVLRTSAGGWTVIDFEGEPARPVAERALPQPPLRDVAGMLRSFDYAARQALSLVSPVPVDRAQTPAEASERLRRSRRANAWAVRNRRAFSTGYAAAGGTDPLCHPVPLRAFEADKAVYEAVYEAQHRPDWLPIPLSAIRRLVHGL